MSLSISENTQAILLLTAPLIVGQSESNDETLKPSEYKKLAEYLLSIKKQPADLIGTDAPAIIENASQFIQVDRFHRLLSRGFQLGQALDRWQSRSIWVISRADKAYPKRLKTQLKENAPPILYGCGDISMRGGGWLLSGRDM